MSHNIENNEKYYNLVHYILYMCTKNNIQLDETVLNDILWKCDTNAYIQNGNSITGDMYIK